MIVLQAAAGTPERAKKLAEAKKALALLQAPPAAPGAKKPEPPKPLSMARPATPKPAAIEPVKPGDPQAFGKLVAQLSDDAASKAAASPGDIGLKTAEDIEKAYSKELATAVFGLKQGEVSGIIETPQALTIAKVTLVQEEVNRTLEQVKPQIVARLSREQKSKEFDEWVKKLKDSADVKIDEAALAALDLTSARAGDVGGRPSWRHAPRPPHDDHPGRQPGHDAGRQAGRRREARRRCDAGSGHPELVRAPLATLIVTLALTAGCDRCQGPRKPQAAPAPRAVARRERRAGAGRGARA